MGLLLCSVEAPSVIDLIPYTCHDSMSALSVTVLILLVCVEGPNLTDWGLLDALAAPISL